MLVECNQKCSIGSSANQCALCSCYIGHPYRAWTGGYVRWCCLLVKAAPTFTDTLSQQLIKRQCTDIAFETHLELAGARWYGHYHWLVNSNRTEWTATA